MGLCVGLQRTKSIYFFLGQSRNADAVDAGQSIRHKQFGQVSSSELYESIVPPEMAGSHGILPAGFDGKRLLQIFQSKFGGALPYGDGLFWSDAEIFGLGRDPIGKAVLILRAIGEVDAENELAAPPAHMKGIPIV